MVRFRGVLTVVMLVGVCSLPLLGGPVNQRAGGGEAGVVNPVAQGKEETPKPFQVIREKLSKPVNLPKGIDPNTPLKDAMEFLSELHEVTILIEDAAFKAEGNIEPSNSPVGLPKMTGIAFRVVLQRLLAGMEPPATVLVRYDHLVVVPRKMTRPANWGTANRHLVPTVDLTFDRRPLEVALREVSDQTGINVVLDPRAGEKAKAGVTAQFHQTALDTAVYLLADMADLKAIALDNVLYVTTRDNAELLTTDLKKSGLKGRFQEGDSGPAPGGQ